MAVTTELKALVDRMPDPDGKDMYTENIDKEAIEKAIAEINEGGRENIVGLIEMLGEPGSQQDVKPRYALRCLANHLLADKDQQARKDLSDALAAALLSEPCGSTSELGVTMVVPYLTSTAAHMSRSRPAYVFSTTSTSESFCGLWTR